MSPGHSSTNRSTLAPEFLPDPDRQDAALAMHRLMTPLAAITANLSLLRKPDRLRREDYEDVLGDTEAATDEIRRALETYFALEEVRAGRPQHLSPAEAEDTVDLEASDLRLRYPGREIHVDLRVDLGGLPFPLGARDLARVSSHLLDNAVKFCDKPRAEIRVVLSATPRSSELLVEDNGRGIEPEDCGRVFERFVQCGPRAPVNPGVGLGLALVRAVARAHGGAVFLDSTPGRGTRVRLTFPADTAVR